MKVMLVAASTVGFRVVRQNTRRFEMFEALLGVAASKKCSLMVLPAGFWSKAKAYQVDEIVLAVQEAVGNSGLAVIGGVDLPSMNQIKQHPEWLRARAIPSFGFAIDSDGRVRGPWRQAVAVAKNASFARVLDVPGRTIDVGGKRVLTFVCGEMTNAYFREALEDEGLDLVVDIAHGDMIGRVAVNSIRAIVRKAKCPVVHTQHLEEAQYTYICREDESLARLDIHEDWDEEIGIAWKVVNV